MSKQTKKVILIFSVVIAVVYSFSKFNKSPCLNKIDYSNINLNEDIDLGDLFARPSSSELTDIISDWYDFDYGADKIEVVDTLFYSRSRSLFVLRQVFDNRIHYGALIFPEMYDTSKKNPLLVWANGLDQRSPNSLVFGGKERKKAFEQLSNYFILIPSFRGQALVINNRYFCSDGFFGDAFDGATDDALRLLAGAEKLIPAVDQSRLAIAGVSRGGTVALLGGIRYPGIRAIVAFAAPTDFMVRSTYQRYGMQFKYQFLSTTREFSEIREKILKSSPVYFVNDIEKDLLIFHGKLDRVVDLSHADKIIQQLEEQKNFDYRLIDSGHRIHDLSIMVEWLAERFEN